MATLAVVLAFSVLVDIGHAFVAKPSGFAQKSKSTNCRNFFSLSSTSGIKRSSTSLGYRNLPSLEQVCHFFISIEAPFAFVLSDFLSMQPTDTKLFRSDMCRKIATQSPTACCVSISSNIMRATLTMKRKGINPFSFMFSPLSKPPFLPNSGFQ